MISSDLIIILLIGMAFMLIPIVIQAKWYQLKLWKTLPIALLLTVIGTLGTKIWFYIENQRLGGQSFYGAIFVVPVLFLLVAKIMRVPYGKLMDLCAPAECVMLAIMKTQCAITGCCAGRVLFTNSQGMPIVFPSQSVELITALVILVMLMLLSRKEENLGMIYPWYMVLYGASRFVLNFFRADTGIYALGLAPGSFWSVWAVLIGIIWLGLLKKRERLQDQRQQE